MAIDEAPQLIIVGTDGSDTAERAVRKAARVAKAFDAQLVIVSVFTRSGPGGSIVPSSDTWEAQASLAAQERVNHSIQSIADLGEVRATGVALPGDPADVLVEEAETRQADLLVVGNKGLQSSRRFLLGSVPNKIVHSAPCDLLIVDTEHQS